MRILSVTVGAVLLLGGSYIVVGERLVGTSANGTINARVLTLRAPIDGTLSLSVRAVGARLARASTIAEIVDQRFDNSRLLDLQRTLATLNTDAERLALQARALLRTREELAAQSEQYREGRVAQITARIGEADAAINSAAARVREAEQALARATELRRRGIQTAAALEQATAADDVARQDMKSAEQRRAYLETELASARNGVFLGDSYNDIPFSAQRIRDLELKYSDLTAEQAQVEGRRQRTREQIDAERVRVQNLTSAALTVPTAGMVWDILTENGEFVRRGQDLVRYVDCAHPMVTASVAESTYNILEAGGIAQFRLFGDPRVFQATIIRLGGAGARELYANLAVAPSAEHLKQFDVALSIPELTEHPDLECAVGRTGRLVYTEGPVALIRQVLARFGV